MQARAERSAAVRTAAVALLLLSAGCSHLPSLHWPWHHPPPAAPAPVHEVDITGAAGADAFPQYWKRNTLLLDLSAVSGSGSITVKPPEGTGWPVRMAVRVTPGAIGVLEVRAAQLVTLPISAGAARPLDLELAPGIYTPHSPEMRISWAAASPAIP